MRQMKGWQVLKGVWGWDVGNFFSPTFLCAVHIRGGVKCKSMMGNIERSSNICAVYLLFAVQNLKRE